jgi:capsular exopolysaccharide synthesis family protein
LNNINAQNGNSEDRQIPQNSDPIIQARDESGKNNKDVQSVKAILRMKQAAPLSESALLPSQFVETRNNERTVRSGMDILRSVFYFKWTILLIFLAVVIPVFTIIWTQIVPKYQARAEIRVRPIMPYLVFRTEDSGMIPLYNSFLNTQVSIIRSLTVLQRVLDKQEVQNTKWFKSPELSFLSNLQGNKNLPIERLRKSLSVRPRSQTEIIDASFVSASSQDAKIIMNAVLDEYLIYVQEVSDETENKLYRQLSDEYTSRKNEVSVLEEDIENKYNELGTRTPQDLVSGKKANIEQIQGRLSEIQQKLAILEWDKKNIEEKIKQDQGGDSNNIPSEAVVQSRYYNDAEWRRLDVDVRTRKHQIENGLLADNHPDMVRIKEDLKFAEELLRERESQLDMQQGSGMGDGAPIIGLTGLDNTTQLKNIEYQIERTKQEEQLVTDSLKQSQEEFDKLFKTVQLISKESNELDRKRVVFNAVQQRLDQKNMERNVPGTIEVLMRAFVPSEYYNDRRVVYSAMVVFMAFAIGCGAAFLRANRNQVILSPADMYLPRIVPHLGSIPLISLKKSLGKSLTDEIENNHFLLIESVRVMRTTLLSKLKEQDSATVLISSSSAGTGKSSFTKVLGKCMAQAGKKVLMIDTDFHKMTLTRRYNLLDKPGFLDSLNSKMPGEALIFPTKTPNLDVMPAGTRGKGVVYEEIANGVLKSSLDVLRQKYSIILLDCSPVMPIADATIISGQVDGTVLVERELVSRRENILHTIERLAAAKGNLLGVVFVGSPDEQQYGYGYDGYYGSDKKTT